MRFFFYLRRALVGLRAGVGGPVQSMPVYPVPRLLEEILQELKSYHAYIVERDKFLNAMDERDSDERAAKSEVIDAAIERMNRLADKLES
jgi:hypothetical protein